MIVKRRSVFLIGGYDPKTPQKFFERLTKELARADATWGMISTVSPVNLLSDGEVGTVDIETAGDGWKVETHFGFLALDKAVLGYFLLPVHVRFFRYAAAFLDYMLSGTFFAMLCRSWRFALYFLYPALMLWLFAWLAERAGNWVSKLSFPSAGAYGIVASLAVFWLLVRFGGMRGFILHLMDLWSFSLAFLRGRRPEAEALFDRFAAAIVARAKAEHVDEFILVGHSTGGGLVLDIAARCLAQDPDFTRRSGRTTLLTVGSTAQKLGMHPAAVAFRKRVQALVDDPRLGWVDIQCHTDMVNFYKCNPVVDMGLQPRVKNDPPGTPFPLTRTVRMKEMLQPEQYRRVRRNLFRLHYQYIFGNTRRYFYDFFLICCGPVPLAERMLHSVVGVPSAKEPAT